MSRWENDVAAAVKNAYAERRALPVSPGHLRRSPLMRLLFGLWRLWLIISLWFVIRWLWHVRYVGKLAAILTSLVWALVGLAILGATLPQNPPYPSVPSNSSNVSSPPRRGAVEISNGAARLGDWGITLTSYSTVRGRTTFSDGPKFEWLVVHWKIHNPTQTAIRTNSLEFSATSFGVNKLGQDPAFVGIGRFHPLTTDYLTPGQTATGDVAFEVFRTARMVKFMFDPSEGNPNFERETWTITR